jgi:hypothetical protein
MERSPKLVRVTKPFVALWVSAICWLVGLVAMVSVEDAVPLELMIPVAAILSTITVSAAAYWGIDQLVRGEMSRRFDRLDLRVSYFDEQLAALALQVLHVAENTEAADVTRRHVVQLVHAMSSLGARLDTLELMRAPTRLMPVVGRVAKSTVVSGNTVVDPKVVNIVDGMVRRASRLPES